MTPIKNFTGNQRLALIALEVGKPIRSPSLKIQLKVSEFTINNWMSIERIISKANDWNISNA